MKPYQRKERFYNSSEERTLYRLSNMAKIYWHSVRTSITQFPRVPKPYFDQGFDKNDWLATTPPPHMSMVPRVTWLGHATFLIQIGGINIITDPILFGLEPFVERMMPLPFPVTSIPPIDYILLSHNHHDHLDLRSLRLLNRDQPQVLAPSGNQHILMRGGLTNAKELSWGEKVDGKASDITFTCLPAHHWSWRSLFDLNKALWCSWLIRYKTYTIYFAGDTAYSDHFSYIGTTYGPITTALMPIGPEEPRALMRDTHIDTIEAIQGFQELNAQHFIPMHWGTFHFGNDCFLDPIHNLRNNWDVLLSPEDRAAKSLHIVKFGEGKEFV